MADIGFRLDHAGLAVADLAAARAWYCELLGLEPELTLRVDAIELDIEMLVHPEHGYRLELLHRPGSGSGAGASVGAGAAAGAGAGAGAAAGSGSGSGAAKPAHPGEAALREGYGHIAFDVTDLDAAFERAVARGARPVMAPGPSPERGVRMAWVADPEGNLVELMHRPRPGELPQ